MRALCSGVVCECAHRSLTAHGHRPIRNGVAHTKLYASSCLYSQLSSPSAQLQTCKWSVCTTNFTAPSSLSPCVLCVVCECIALSHLIGTVPYAMEWHTLRCKLASACASSLAALAPSFQTCRWNACTTSCTAPSSLSSCVLCPLAWCASASLSHSSWARRPIRNGVAHSKV